MVWDGDGIVQVLFGMIWNGLGSLWDGLGQIFDCFGLVWDYLGLYIYIYIYTLLCLEGGIVWDGVGR